MNPSFRKTGGFLQNNWLQTLGSSSAYGIGNSTHGTWCINLKAYPPFVNIFSAADLLTLIVLFYFWKELITYVQILIEKCQL